MEDKGCHSKGKTLSPMWKTNHMQTMRKCQRLHLVGGGSILHAYMTKNWSKSKQLMELTTTSYPILSYAILYIISLFFSSLFGLNQLNDAPT